MNVIVRTTKHTKPIQTPHDVAIEEINQIARKHGTTVRDIMGRSRFKEHAQARQEAFYYFWQTHSWSLPRIGRLFQRDHTTILSGIGAHMKRIGIDHPYRDHYENQQRRMAGYHRAGKVEE